MIFVTVHAKAYFVILATIHYMGSNKTMKYVNTLFHTTIVRPVPCSFVYRTVPAAKVNRTGFN